MNGHAKGSAVLDGLERIEWGRLRHAYGAADDVPGLLRQLTSTDPRQTEAALEALFGNIYHQGTIYEATAQAVPFLLELVAEPAVAGREKLLVLLAEIARGTPVYGAVPEDPWMPTWRPPGDTERGRKQAWEWVLATRRAVADGVPIVLAMLEDPDVEVRRVAPYTLAACPDRAGEVLPNLAVRFAREPDPTAQAGIVLA